MLAHLRSIGAATLLGLTLFASWQTDAAAQNFPDGQVTIIVPFAAGGGVDTIARLVADDLRAQWSVPVLVENMPGGSGMIGAQALTRAEPDGRTLMLATAGELAVNTTLLSGSLSYDVAKDFAPVALAARIPNVFVVKGDSSFANVGDFVAAAKQNPDTMTYGSSGVGNPQHLTGALLGYRAGVELVHVPYKGSSQQVLDTMGGNIDATFASAAAVLANVQDGSLKALAVTSKERMGVLPDVPAVGETAGLEGFDLVNWFGFVTKAGTPPETVAILHESIEKALQTEATKTRLQAIGAEFVPMTTAEFTGFIGSETEKFAGIIKDASITAE
ncbi:Bug family tripartite tricarboxylate transporter substrate binding protein [Antarcticirhabdus aurantiaca]|uniref:Tripartite tricarboxylate transporter substrate binding protein n=1 Tax=Antarcticirhabdus aurantiaca TaxID=2606717 RepID=A0ACD4NVY0_9HYPH|nr:tripartite tricarboxylate transporter substrate binding protein [Antarcticirhabdus aurantiaca]WAJ31007.1 tripartite tricarboxylate transporter substrate binding protein [Jeongeuplla avenae]